MALSKDSTAGCETVANPRVHAATQRVDDRRHLRQDKSKPLVVTFKALLEHQIARVSAKAKIADEIRYGLKMGSLASSVAAIVAQGRFKNEGDLRHRRRPLEGRGGSDSTILRACLKKALANR
jgi:hypothetical protein